MTANPAPAQKSDSGKRLLIVIAVIVVACILIACCTIGVLVLFGPAISNVFSNVNNGLK